MPIISVRTALAASGTANPLQGNQYEYVPFDAQLEAGIQADATGVLGTFYSGSDVLMQESPVQLGTINVQPKYPDDFYLEDAVMAGERLNEILRDTSAAARVVMSVVRLTPLG